MSGFSSWSNEPLTGLPMSERRHREPLPLGGEDGLPFSKGLLARALIATGVASAKAYELALTAEADLARLQLAKPEVLEDRTLGLLVHAPFTVHALRNARLAAIERCDHLLDPLARQRAHRATS